MVVLACNPSFGNLETEESGVQSQGHLLSSFEASLVCVRLFLENNQTKQNKKTKRNLF